MVNQNFAKTAGFRSVGHNYNVPFPDRLSTLGLLSLQYRCLRGDMIHIYQMGINWTFSLPAHL